MSTNKTLTWLLIASLLISLSYSVSADQVRLEATKDNSIVLVDGEEQVNAGSLGRIRIKGNQHLVAMDFDFDSIRGRLVESAVLVCRQADNTVDGVTLSTIQADWDEHKSNAITSGLNSLTGWGWKSARFPAVTGGNSFSLLCRSDSVIKDNAYHWPIDPDLIHANALGASYGICIHEFGCDYSRNPQIFSRQQSGKAPFLLLTFGGAEPLPGPVSDLQVTHKGDIDTIRLHMRAPDNGFAYSIDVNGQSLPRWNIPFVESGRSQTVPIRDIIIIPGSQLTISVTTLNRIGARSAPVVITTSAPTERPVPTPDIPPLKPAAPHQTDIAVIGLLDKYDFEGNPIGNLPGDYLTNNSLFDGRTITLSAAKGEIVGFQLLLKGQGNVKPACILPGTKTELFKALYVQSPNGLIPDPLVPFDTLQLSPSHYTPVAVDVYVPFAAAAGTISGFVQITDRVRIPIQLRVYDVALPRQASFLCEMNSYGLPDDVSDFYKLQKVAYDHRTHCNILYYSHSTAAPGARKCNLDMTLPDSRRMDEKRLNNIVPGAKTAWWDDFAAAFGPYFTGECFKNDHRGPIPAPGFYLPFHESWPLNVRAFFNGNPDAYKAFEQTPVYAETFVNILSDFIATASRNRWNRTGFQLYLNNKGSLKDTAKAPWILDEPTEYWDYRALAYYADLTRRAKGDNCPVNLQYRIDISRPQFDRGELHRKADLWVVSTDAMRNYPRLIADRTEQTGEDIWVYGTTNRPEESSRQTYGWVIWAYRQGAKGVVPWQTVNKDGTALTQADQLGLFIFDKDADNRTAIRHSIRLKAYRRAQQDIEYLELLRHKLNLSDLQIRSFIDHYLDLSGDLLKQSEADAGTARYLNLSPNACHSLRIAALTLLTEN